MSKFFVSEASGKETTASITPKTNCDLCKLHESCTSPRLRFSGDGKKNVLIVGSHPYPEEDRTGVYGRDKEQYFLIEALDQIGIDFHRDAYYTTAVNCRPAGAKEPPTKAVNLCRARLLRLIEKLRPRAIILLGDVPFDSLIYTKLSGRVTGMKYNAFVGECIPDQEYKTYLCPVYPVSYLMSRKSYEDGNSSKPLYERDPSVYATWKHHLARAFEVADQPFYEVSYEGDVFTTTDKEKACEWVQDALSWEKMAFDFETTGIRPFGKGHRIHTAAISNGLFAFAFPFFQDKKFQGLWEKLMASDVGKIAHNIQFEALWNKVQVGNWPNNWIWDTMNAAHCLANQKPTGQKYLVYAKFGVVGYDDSAGEFLSSSDADKALYGANARNIIEKAPMEDILHYNGLDALFCFKLYEQQNASYLPFQKEGIDFFLESAQTLVKGTFNGFGIDEKVIGDQRQELLDKIQKAHNLVMEADVVKKWDGKEPFNYDSSQQLGHLLFDVLKIEPKSFTPGKKPSVDKDALPLYDVPIVQSILEKRHLTTILNKVEEYNRERNGDRVHPYFNLNRADTFRPSGSDPNLLNIFKREEFAKKMVRSFLVPHKGNRIIEYDTKAAEVMVGACYHKDKNMIRYLTDSGSDMHRDAACDCYLATWDEIIGIVGSKEKAKEVRQNIKSDWTFAEFFGSFYKQTAPALWDTAKQYGLVEHLRSKGIKTFSDFESHIKKAEEKLWNVRFPQYKEWREKQWKDYQKKGYVDLLTGFRAYGPMSRNNSFNTPIQGTSYHLVQRNMNWLTRKMEAMCERSYVITQVYDSIVMDVHPSEEDMVDKYVWLYGTQKIREYYDWLIVPIVLEKERSEIDGSWAEMSACGVLGGYE